jgi:hypothetical protein
MRQREEGAECYPKATETAKELLHESRFCKC